MSLSPEREQQICERALAATVCPKSSDQQHVWSGSSFTHVECSECRFVRPRGERAEEAAELLAEVDRLRTESEQRLGELLFWHFDYREAMDNYHGEHAEVRKLRAKVAAVTALLPDEPTEDINASWIPPRRVRMALNAEAVVLAAGEANQ